MIGKGTYLRQLTSAMTQMRSVEVGRELEGSSPPSVFIGSWNYPRVYAGPMVAPMHGDTSVMDMPESWIAGNRTQGEIIGYRLNLVRGRKVTDALDVGSRFVEKLQEIALSASSVESEVSFTETPRGSTFSEDHPPFGPSAPIGWFDINGSRWDENLERVFYDSDLPAKDAVIRLHRQNVPFSAIQKAFSTGTMGRGGARRLVPTRWSITAVDTTIGDHLLADVKRCPVIDTVRVHEFSSLHNNFAVILVPTGWQYEWSEAFLRVLGNEEYVFSDHEIRSKKNEYSHLGGCYYSCKMAVLEALAREQKQAGAIVLREAHRGYVPLGVFNVRENVRSAMRLPGLEFEDMRSALAHIGQKFTLPMDRFAEAGALLRGVLAQKQTRLADFCPVRAA